MFVQLNPANARRQHRLLVASCAVHGLLLAWLLRSPEPIRLTPNSLALGQNGRAVTRLYWSSKNPDDSSHSSSDLATQGYRHERLGPKLTRKPPAKLPKLPLPLMPVDRKSVV